MSHARLFPALAVPLLAVLGVACSPDAGTLDPAHTTYDFGAVGMGRTLEKKIRLTNYGTLPLTLRALTKMGGDAAAPDAVFDLAFVPGTELPPGQSIEVLARFQPPVREAGAEYGVTVQLAAEDSASVERTATITLLGRSVARSCEVLAELDFGSVTVGDGVHLELTLDNPTAWPTEATVGEPYSTSGDGVAFTFSADSLRGSTSLAPGSSRKVAFDFRPSEARDYQAFVGVRPSPECPEQTVTLSGAGATNVLSSVPAFIDCGYATPGVRITRTVTFRNVGATPVLLSQIRTLNNSEFGVAFGLSELTVPAATRSATGEWVAGEANLEVYCRPVSLGPRQTSLTFQTGFVTMPSGSIALKVFGGGPDIQVTSSPVVYFGKVAYLSNGAAYQQKKLTVMNVGTAPSTPDPDANLRLGQAETGYGPPYVGVEPLNGLTAPDEFTVTLPASYDPAVGLEATVGKNTAELVVEFRPQSVGLKSALIALYSNDQDEPVVWVVASAEVVTLPPCNYTITPTTLDFGLISPPLYRDAAFTVRNAGTNPDEVCLVSQLDLAPGSAPFFSLPNGPIDQRELLPGEGLTVTVRASQGPAPAGVGAVSGQVRFFISSELAPQATVDLKAQL